MLVSATPRTPASGLFFPRTHRCSAWLGAAALPLPSLGLLPARYDSGRPGFPVPAVAVRGESGQTSADTRADYAPCGPPARHAANFRLLLALLGAADHWQSCDNHLYNPAPGEILPRLVGVQPQMEDLGQKTSAWKRRRAWTWSKTTCAGAGTASTANSGLITSSTSRSFGTSLLVTKLPHRNTRASCPVDFARAIRLHSCSPNHCRRAEGVAKRTKISSSVA